MRPLCRYGRAATRLALRTQLVLQAITACAAMAPGSVPQAVAQAAAAAVAAPTPAGWPTGGARAASASPAPPEQQTTRRLFGGVDPVGSALMMLTGGIEVDEGKLNFEATGPRWAGTTARRARRRRARGRGHGAVALSDGQLAERLSDEGLESALLQIGLHVARIPQQLERGTFIGGAAAAGEHMRDDPEAVGFQRAARSFELNSHSSCRASA